MNETVKVSSFPRLQRITRSLQTIWSLVGVCLLTVLAAEGALRVVFHVKDSLAAENAPPAAALPWGDKTASWTIQDCEHGALDEYLRDWNAAINPMPKKVEWHSYVYFRRPPLESRYTNIDKDGIRRSWGVRGMPADRKRIFLFGGSTLWGAYARDDYTIPSHLARLLAERGVDVAVTNFGESGHVSTQGLIALMLELRAGNRPDLVVFYDGINDVHSAFQNRQAGLPLNEDNRRREFNLLQDPQRLQEARARADDEAGQESWQFRFALERLGAGIRRKVWGARQAGAGPAAASPEEYDRLAREAVRAYEENLKLVRALSEAYHFDALFFWQPVVFTRQALTPYEQGKQNTDYAREFYLKTCEHARARESLQQVQGFRNLDALFDTDSQGYYLDFAHITEEGNERVARAMLDDVLTALGKQR